MIYQSTITTPNNTLKDNPLKTSVKMVKGLIYQFDLYFPPGSSGLCGVAVFDTEVQIYPRGREEYFVGDNVTISFPDLHFLSSENQILEVYTYNLDTDYEHQIQVRFGIVDSLDFQSAFIPSISFEGLEKSIDELNRLMTDIKESSTKKGFVLFRPRS